MRTKEITHIVNSGLKRLEDRIKSRPKGGDFNSLRKFLANLSADISDFETMLDALEWKLP